MGLKVWWMNRRTSHVLASYRLRNLSRVVGICGIDMIRQDIQGAVGRAAGLTPELPAEVQAEGMTGEVGEKMG